MPEPTPTAPLPLRTSTGVRLLGELQALGAEYATREQRLEQDFVQQRKTLYRRHREALQQTVTRLETEEADLRHRWTAAEEHTQAFVAQREARIQGAYRATLHGLQQRGRRKKEQWYSTLQMRHLQAERGLPEETKALEADYAAWSHHLAEERLRLIHTTRRVRSALGAFPSFLRRLRTREVAAAEPPAGVSRAPLLAELQGRLEEVAAQLQDFRTLLAPRLFALWPVLLIVLLVGAGAAVALAAHTQAERLIYGGAAVGLLILGVALHQATRRRVQPQAETLLAAVQAAQEAFAQCRTVGQAQHEEERAALQERFAREFSNIETEWTRGEDIERRFAAQHRQKLEKQILRLMARQAQRKPALLAAATQHYAPRVEALSREAEAKKEQLNTALEMEITHLAAAEAEGWRELSLAWHQATAPRCATLDNLLLAAGPGSIPWSAHSIAAWEPARAFPAALPFGRLELDLGATPHPHRLRAATGGNLLVAAPLALDFGEEGSLLIESPGPGDAGTLEAIQSLILRGFTSVPVGKLIVTIIDPVGLGRHFAGLMHLGDYEESLINRRIWTQRDQIEDRLGELNEHIEKVIQMYLRSDYATIAEYNAQAGSVAEKLHFLVVADFPHGWSETALQRLQSILASGPRCGVWTLLQWDARAPLPDGLTREDLRRGGLALQEDAAGQYHLKEAPAGAKVVLEHPPERELAAALVHYIGQRSVDSNRVEVPFAYITPEADGRWRGSTTGELRVPIGRTGATKLQYLALGKGTRQHALVAGKTGSGKSTLFHVMITNLALTCTPDEVEFYLIDFKKGVEFKCYATHRLPHARVVAIESDREFGLSVLRRVDEELRRRGDLFRRLGVQDVPGYRRVSTDPLPRTLLLIDEFQEFFMEDDTLAQEASLLFDRIVRQGRAFGIHVVLGSQTLGGAYTLARSTIGQMVVRIALQSNEADAYLIMDENNAAPRLLSRPGEGIYNDAAGASAGNSPFQVVWLPDAERDQLLADIHTHAEAAGWRYQAPVVFEGNAPSEISQNALLESALRTPPARPVAAPKLWLGMPHAIKGPTEAVFPRQSGAHLLIAGQRAETAAALLGLGLFALAAQAPAGAARFLIFSQAVPGTPEAELFAAVAQALPEQTTLTSGAGMGAELARLMEELRARQARENAGAEPPIYVCIYELQRFKKLRQEDDFSFSSRAGAEGEGNPAEDLAELIREGSAYGIYLLVSIDTFGNVGRFLNRRALGEFGQRVLFQMSANDSASLMESPAASQLGLHRAVLYREQDGTMETFRPYALPDSAWLAEAVAHLQSRTPVAAQP